MTDHNHDSERVSLGRLLFRVVLAAIIVGLLVAYSMSFQVSEGYNAVVTRFGDPKRSVHEAGLFFKWPWPIEQAHQIDVRRRIHNTPYSATFTRDRKNVILLSYVVWRVENPLLFLQSVGNRQDAEEKLSEMVVHNKNFYLGRYDLSTLVSTDPQAIRTDEIEQSILTDVAKDAWEKFGIRVEQVGIKRIAYPEENMTAVLQQMKEERKAEAGRLRAEGAKEASDIVQTALVRKEEIIREGREEAGEISGGSQKKAAEIYAVATQLDPHFFTFWRKLEAVKKTLGPDDTLILRTNQSIFDVLESAPELLETNSESDQHPPARQPNPADQLPSSATPSEEAR